MVPELTENETPIAKENPPLKHTELCPGTQAGVFLESIGTRNPKANTLPATCSDNCCDKM